VVRACNVALELMRAMVLPTTRRAGTAARYPDVSAPLAGTRVLWQPRRPHENRGFDGITDPLADGHVADDTSDRVAVPVRAKGFVSQVAPVGAVVVRVPSVHIARHLVGGLDEWTERR
jgi:hypothetical protein